MLSNKEFVLVFLGVAIGCGVSALISNQTKIETKEPQKQEIREKKIKRKCEDGICIPDDEVRVYKAIQLFDNSRGIPYVVAKVKSE